jgi:hypothetical protein
MSREDEEHVAFIIVDGIFCYVSMPYGIKNALPTFVCATHQIFGDLIRDLVEMYVDEIVIKIKSHSFMLDNLAIVFDRLCLMRTMLHLDKCVFGASAGKLLDFLISHRGIEANPEKIKAIEEMWRPTQRRSRQSKRCGHQHASRMSRSSRDARSRSASLSLDWQSELSHS